MKSQSLKIDSLQVVLSRQVNDSNKVKVLWELAYSFKRIGLFDSCEFYAAKSTELSVVINYPIGEAKGLSLIGNCFIAQSEFLKAKKYLNDALYLFSSLGDKYKIAETCLSIGTIYNYQGNLPQALQYYLFCLKIYEEFGKLDRIADLYNNIGGIYYGQRNFNLAIRHYLAAIHIWKVKENYQAVAFGYYNVGLSYYSLARYDEALKYFQWNLNLSKEIGYDAGIAAGYAGIGGVYEIQGLYDKSLSFLLLSLEMEKKLGQKEIISYKNLVVANVLIKLGRFEEAKSHLVEALEMSTSIGAKHVTQEAYLLFSTLDSAEHNYEDAYFDFKKYIKLRDELHNDSNTQTILELATQYEFDKEQILLKQIENDNQRKVARRNILQYTLILLFIMIVFVSVMALGMIKVSDTVSRALIFISLMLLFEFVLVLIDPLVDSFTKGVPIYKLLVNVTLATLIFPIHSFLERRFKKRIRKN